MKKILIGIRNTCVVATIILVVLNFLSITNFSLLIILSPIIAWLILCTVVLIVNLLKATYIITEYKKGNTEPWNSMQRVHLERISKLHGEDSSEFAKAVAECNTVKTRLDMEIGVSEKKS